MAKLEIPDNIKGAVLVYVGDADGDGKHGVGALVYGDIPDFLDGKPGLEPIDFLNKAMPEFDELPADAVPHALDKVLDIVKPFVTVVSALVGRK